MLLATFARERFVEGTTIIAPWRVSVKGECGFSPHGCTQYLPRQLLCSCSGRNTRRVGAGLISLRRICRQVPELSTATGAQADDALRIEGNGSAVG